MTVGVETLTQNGSAVVAEAASGATIVITDGGVPVAQIVPLGGRALGDLERAGPVRKRRRSVIDLPPPRTTQDSLNDEVRRGRGDERY